MGAEQPISVDEYADIISDFLRDIKFSMPSTKADPTLQDPVISHFKSQQDWDPSLVEKAVKMAHWTSTGLGLVYPYVSQETKILYGTFSTYMFLIDDSDGPLVTELQDFETNLAHGRPQTSPFLKSLASFMGTMRAHFGPYSSSMIFKSMIEFVSGRLIEHRFNGALRPTVGAVGFPQYLRHRAGVAEPYAHFAFPEHMYPEHDFLEKYILVLGDMRNIVDHINDILSFYKESVIANEDVNYISALAMTRNISVAAALRQTCQKAAQSIESIRTVLVSDPRMLRTTEEFIQGYTAWHINQARYRLADLNLSYTGPECEGRKVRKSGQRQVQHMAKPSAFTGVALFLSPWWVYLTTRAIQILVFA